MKQVFESLKDGKIELLDVPVPNVGSGKILVKNYYSLISSGTERSMLEFWSKGLVNKKVSNIYPLDKAFNFGTHKSDREFCSHPI